MIAIKLLRYRGGACTACSSVEWQPEPLSSCVDIRLKRKTVRVTPLAKRRCCVRNRTTSFSQSTNKCSTIQHVYLLLPPATARMQEVNNIDQRSRCQYPNMCLKDDQTKHVRTLKLPAARPARCTCWYLRCYGIILCAA